MKVIIDRFEENFAVCEKENCEMINIELQKLPAGVKAGDILDISEHGITIAPDETAQRKSHIKKLMDEVWE